MIVYERRFDLYGSEESVVFDSSIVHIESYERFMRCDIAMMNDLFLSVYEHQSKALK